MRVINIHGREIHAASSEVGELIDSLASENDVLWPRKVWPAMRFDRPLGVGATGGHGPIRYNVEEFSPGAQVMFRFTSPAGFDGYHHFEVVPLAEKITILRHTIDMSVRGAALISWPLAFRPMHDALLEDLLARAQASLGIAPLIRPWSPWVRFLRWISSGGKARSQKTICSIVRERPHDKTAPLPEP
jgi:hypothetical protein